MKQSRDERIEAEAYSELRALAKQLADESFA